MLSRTEFESALETQTKVINQASAVASQATILTFVCNEVCDRITFFLNIEDESYDEKLVKIGARICSGVFTQTTTNIAGTSVDSDIKSMSDNGQSITYGDATKNYLATATDGEIFGGFVELLKPYRRVHVVGE